MSSPSPSTRKGIGRGVRNFDPGAGGREKQNAVLFDTYANSRRIQPYEITFRALTTKFWLNPALWTQYGASWSPGGWSQGQQPMPGERKNLLGEAFSAVREDIFATVRPGRSPWPPLVGSAPALRMQEQEISSAPRPGR